MSTHGHPIVDAAWRELCAVHRETGGGDALNPNKSPEYIAAHRVFVAVLDAYRAIVFDRTAVRMGERRLQVVNGAR